MVEFYPKVNLIIRMRRGGILMKPKHILNPIIMLAVIVGMIILFASCAKEESLPEMDLENRESILDRVVYIEPELITDIPFVERWCDRLELKKHRIKVGDAKLYVEEEGKGMPLVLINGGSGGTHHYFHPWFSKAKKYARIIYYDQRGCGLSDFEPGEEGYSVHQAAEMNLDDTWMHGQYDMKYSLSPYARERMKEPFQCIDNRTTD
jgi:hypothetical protein